MDEIKTLNQRNTVAVEAALKDIYNRIYQQDITINELKAMVGALQSRINQQEQTIAILRAKAAGNGPSA